MKVRRIAAFALVAGLASGAGGEGPAAELRSQQAEPSPTTMPLVAGRGSEEPPQQAGRILAESVLDLPSVWTPSPSQPLPVPPPAMAEVTIPDAFIGCWKGTPSDWDYTHVFNGRVIGSPGEMVFCYSRTRVDIPKADVAITPGRRFIDLLSNLFLAYDTFTAHGIQTDVYGVSPTKVHGRTTLTVGETVHQLDLIPVREAVEPSIVDWAAELVRGEEIVVRARQVLYYGTTPLFAGEWHCDFRRTDASAAP